MLRTRSDQRAREQRSCRPELLDLPELLAKVERACWVTKRSSPRSRTTLTQTDGHLSTPMET